MYQLKDQHIDYILNDISARGVTIEDLQYNLLDHICCVIENNLEENGDFENFYSKTVKTFFKNELYEIEDETISLIIFKNYYTMKKAMIISGTISTLLFAVGLIFKFLHWPGAAMALVLGISSMSLVFLPLMFILKAKEKQNIKDKVTIGIGALAGILISLGILFKVMHWPGANLMMNGSLVILLLLFLPIYFFSGIRNPETKVNTIVSSILLFAACGLLLTLMRSPKATHSLHKALTENYLRNVRILNTEESLLQKLSAVDTIATDASINRIIQLCEKIRNELVFIETGSRDLEKDFYSKNVIIEDHSLVNAFNDLALQKNTSELILELNKYNEGQGKNAPIQIDGEIFKTIKANNYQSISTTSLLEQLTQLQIMMVQQQVVLL